MRRVMILVVLASATFFSVLVAQTGANMARLSMVETEALHEEHALPAEDYQQLARQRAVTATERVNVFIISKEKKFNLASTVFRADAFFRRMFNRRIVVIKVGSLSELASKTDAYMQDHPKQMIGHLWIDSHGKYKTGHSLFNVGSDTLNAFTLKSGENLQNLEKLTAYCDEQTIVTIGSCYGAADFQRPGNDLLEPSYMAGDSLMLGMSEIFQISPIYGSQSWIMVKPFLFGRRWGISGYPLERKFMDEIFKPVWERLGQWKMVQAGGKTIEDVPTPFLTASGDLKTDGKSYLSDPRNKRRMEKKIRHLKPGMYKMGRK